MKTAIYYASSTGNTKEVAEKISKNLGGIDLFDISQNGFKNIENYEKLILGTSTWGDGDLQDDWEELWDEFCDLDFTAKTLAFFGLGDQDSYADTFCNAMASIYEQACKNGARVIGQTSKEDYTFDESEAVKDGKFIGLALDEDNEYKKTDERIQVWCESIKKDIL